ncbi:MAG: hypothetical protein GY849_24055, partial [Deltaproteobacteria bacterium]|nr:hypothetical protein [Deltaproteobacteria bacterium]
EQIDHLREELGQEVLKAFEGWQGGKGESEALWEALKFRRNEERTRLEGSQDNLAKAKKDLDQRLQAKEREIKDWEATQKTALKQSLADMKATHVAAMSAAQAKIETSTKSIHARVDAAMATKERNAAWGPARDRTVAYVGKAFDKVLKDAGYTDESAPQSIWQIGKEIKLFTKLVRGQTPA